MDNNYCVIMAGGVGTRFWPISTQKTPKQFLDILGTGQSLLQLTFQRVNKIIPAENILVVTNVEYKGLVAEHLPSIPEKNILLEPMRRNTAPCIAYAAYRIKKENENANMVITPSDHLITDESVYLDTLKKALAICEQYPYLLTLGIKPSRPETGYGYIQFKPSTLDADPELKAVKTFTEKPDLEHAKMFMESGEFLWNSGVFIWNVNTLLKGFEKHLPDLYETFEEGWGFYAGDAEQMFIDKIYPSCDNVSIDYGLMEKAKNVYVLPASFGWSDLGTWSSVHEKLKPDAEGNAVVGGKALLYNSKNCLIVSKGDKLIVANGLVDYVVAESENAILIYPKAKEQEIKSVVSDVRVRIGEKYT